MKRSCIVKLVPWLLVISWLKSDLAENTCGQIWSGIVMSLGILWLLACGIPAVSCPTGDQSPSAVHFPRKGVLPDCVRHDQSQLDWLRAPGWQKQSSYAHRWHSARRGGAERPLRPEGNRILLIAWSSVREILRMTFFAWPSVRTPLVFTKIKSIWMCVMLCVNHCSHTAKQ